MDTLSNQSSSEEHNQERESTLFVRWEESGGEQQGAPDKTRWKAKGFFLPLL